MADIYPATPDKDTLLERLRAAVDDDFVVRGFFEPLATWLADRQNVTPRQICDAIVATREAFLDEVEPHAHIMEPLLRRAEESIVRAVADPSLVAEVRLGLLMDTHDRDVGSRARPEPAPPPPRTLGAQPPSEGNGHGTLGRSIGL